MGYRDFVKDYKIEYVDVPGRKLPKAVRVYVGPWYSFAKPEKITFLRWFYLIGMAVMAVLLLIPMCIDCSFTRIWYIQVPATMGWIPWVLAVGSTWRLWTAKERFDREHNSLLGSRMSGASLFLMGFCLISFLGTIYRQLLYPVQPADYVVCMCYALATGNAIAMFSRRKGLDTQMVQPGEKK